MYFALICKDKPGALETRMATRPTHVEYLNGLKADGRLKIAGPFLDEEGKSMGSLLIVEVDDRAGAQAIADGDPYAKVGLFASTEILPWNWTFNAPESK